MEGQSGGRVVYPVVAAQYKLLEEIGYGLGSTVHRAVCLLYNEVVAIKTLDLESSNAKLVISQIVKSLSPPPLSELRCKSRSNEYFFVCVFSIHKCSVEAAFDDAGVHRWHVSEKNSVIVWMADFGIGCVIFCVFYGFWVGAG